jgi:hypothetical protein
LALRCSLLVRRATATDARAGSKSVSIWAAAFCAVKSAPLRDRRSASGMKSVLRFRLITALALVGLANGCGTSSITRCGSGLPSCPSGLECVADICARRMAEARLAEARLAEGRLAEGRLAEARLAEARLAEARLAEARLAEARLAEARLAAARWAAARWAAARWAAARWAAARWAAARWAAARVAAARVAEARRAEARRAEARLAAARLAGVPVRMRGMSARNSTTAWTTDIRIAAFHWETKHLSRRLLLSLHPDVRTGRLGSSRLDETAVV